MSEYKVPGSMVLEADMGYERVVVREWDELL